MTKTPVERDDKGQFVKGQSGNPDGKPKGRKNVITSMKQDLEIALREGINPEEVKGIIASMVAEAQNGNVGAGKLILDKVLSNATNNEDALEGNSGWTFVIENATIQAHEPDEGNIIDVTPTEVE